MRRRLSARVFGSPTATVTTITRLGFGGGEDTSSLGVCFMIGLYHLIVYFFRRQNLPALYFWDVLSCVCR